MNVGALLDQRLIVCMGSGGVGKTTTAAGLAVAAAQRGRTTAVITFDPAQRLKDALGLQNLAVDPSPVELPHGYGRLDALALDTKTIFDALILRVAPSSEVAQRILNNRLYQELSQGLGGSAEYMAMEKLHELLAMQRYDLIVVDTPPSAHAAELLGVPLRVSELIASGAVRILKAPYSILAGKPSGLARLTLSTLLRGLERWSGVDLVRELADFASGFEALLAGFQERAGEVERVLRRRRTSFVVVATPERDTIDAAIGFCHDLRAERFRISGVFANRFHRFGRLAERHVERFPLALRAKLSANYAAFLELSARDDQSLARLRREARVQSVWRVPGQETPPCSLPELVAFATVLTRASSAPIANDSTT